MPIRQLLFVIGMFLLVAGIMVGQQLSPGPHHPSRQDYYQRQAQQEYQAGSQKSEPSETLWQRTIRDPNAFFAFWVAAFTAILALSTAGLWIVTARSAAIAERALLDVERALVIVSDISVNVLIRNNRVIGHRISIVMVNKGRTVGKRLLTNANVATFDGDNAVSAHFRYPDRNAPSRHFGIVGPGVKMPLPLDIAIQYIVGIQQKLKTCISYLWAEYVDVFDEAGDRHRTEFCARVEVIGDPYRIPTETTSVSPLEFSAYGAYNGIDGECFYNPGETPIAYSGELPTVTQPPPP